MYPRDFSGLWSVSWQQRSGYTKHLLFWLLACIWWEGGAQQHLSFRGFFCSFLVLSISMCCFLELRCSRNSVPWNQLSWKFSKGLLEVIFHPLKSLKATWYKKKTIIPLVVGRPGKIWPVPHGKEVLCPDDPQELEFDAYSVFVLTERELQGTDAHGVNAGGKGIRWA